MNVQMKDGYCFVLQTDAQNWRAAKDDNWEVVLRTPTGNEKYVGIRWIDGCRCAVFRAPAPNGGSPFRYGRYYAQTTATIGLG